MTDNVIPIWRGALRPCFIEVVVLTKQRYGEYVRSYSKEERDSKAWARRKYGHAAPLYRINIKLKQPAQRVLEITHETSNKMSEERDYISDGKRQRWTSPEDFTGPGS